MDIVEGNLTFCFPAGWKVCKFDESSFYRNQFQRVCGGAKAVDVVALSPEHCAWLIEIKDYRVHTRTRSEDLSTEVACKVRDTLAALFCANVSANDPHEKHFACRALASKSIRIVLHLEQPVKQSKLFPRPIDPANIKLRMKQLLHPVDAHPKVLDRHITSGIGWNVH